MVPLCKSRLGRQQSIYLNDRVLNWSLATARSSPSNLWALHSIKHGTSNTHTIYSILNSEHLVNYTDGLLETFRLATTFTFFNTFSETLAH